MTATTKTCTDCGALFTGKGKRCKDCRDSGATDGQGEAGLDGDSGGPSGQGNPISPNDGAGSRKQTNMSDQYEDLRDKIRSDRKALRTSAQNIVAKAKRENRDLTLNEDVAVETALSDADAQTKRLKELPKVKRSAGPAVAKRSTYSPAGQFSWFMDQVAIRARTPMAGSNPVAARNRLLANNDEVRSELGRREARSQFLAQRRGVTMLVSDGQPIESRDLSNTDGVGGEFLPPVWIMDRYASIARSSAPLLALADAIPLPNGCFEVNVPNFSSFVPTTQAQAVAMENVPQTPSNITTDLLSSEVQTVSSFVVASQQVMDRASGPGVLDAILVQEASEGHAAFIESELFVGDGIGSGGDIPGIYDTCGQNVVYTDGSPTPGALIVAVGKAAAQVGKNRLRFPEAVFVSPARAAWLFSTNDTVADGPAMKIGTGAVNRPPFDGKQDSLDVLGPVAGIPTYASGALEVDAAANTDLIVLGRPSDLLVLQSDPVFETFEEPYGQQLGVQFRARCYFASILRYPEGFATVYGSGTIRPAGYGRDTSLRRSWMCAGLKRARAAGVGVPLRSGSRRPSRTPSRRHEHD